MTIEAVDQIGDQRSEVTCDTIAIAWYAVIRGGLSALAPSFGGGVGIVAARLLTGGQIDDRAVARIGGDRLRA